MTKARIDGLYLLFLGSAAFLLLGIVLGSGSPVSMEDFSGQYYPAKCLLQHCDPYNVSEVLRVTQESVGDTPWNIGHSDHFARFIYPPTVFALTTPFAMLPWGPAHILWKTISMASLILASILVWQVGADYSPTLSGALIGFLLANSEVFIVFGNMAGIVVGLCVGAAWCFLRGRFVPVGILSLAVALAIKPHNAGLIWLYFLLAGGAFRKWALQTLIVTVILSLPQLLWVWQVSPHWMEEWNSNIQAFAAHGNTSDPALAAIGVVGMNLVISLQSVFSEFWNDPRIYNLATLLTFTPILLVWAFVTLRSRPSTKGALLALASIVPLSMLPVYHRQHDAKLLLLTVPACALLASEGRLIGRLAVLVNGLAFLLTADLLWAIPVALSSSWHLSTSSILGKTLMAAQIFPVPITLLGMGIFYLWIYARRSTQQDLAVGT